MHLDRGSAYTSFTHQTFFGKVLLAQQREPQIHCSHSASTECFFLNLKMERDWQSDDANHADATSDKAVYVVGLNIEVRLHSKLGN